MAIINVGGVGTDSVSTTDATATLIKTIPTNNDSVVSLLHDLVGVKDDGSQIFRCRHAASFKNDGGVLSQVGSGNNLELENPDAWGGISYTISGTDIQVKVTGKLATNVKWQMLTEQNKLEY